MNQRLQAGYILVVTLMILSVITFLVVYTAGKATVFSVFARSSVDREKAQLLATSGIQLVISQLATIDVVPEQNKQDNKAEPTEKAESADDKSTEQLLTKLVPLLGRWQQFTLQQERDGVRGTLSLCIMSEDGKINLNQFYDVTQKKFYNEGAQEGDRKKLLQQLCKSIAPLIKTDDQEFFNEFQALYKKKLERFNDVTELLELKSLAPLKEHIFYEPPEQRGDKKTDKRPVYLTDIFTVHSAAMTLQPWLLSDSVRALFGLQRVGVQAPSVDNIKKVKQKAAWDKDWDIHLTPIYGKKFSDVPGYSTTLLATTFDASTFSVLSYAKIGKITQRLLAILERSRVTEQDGSKKFTVIIKKLYWL